MFVNTQQKPGSVIGSVQSGWCVSVVFFRLVRRQEEGQETGEENPDPGGNYLYCSRPVCLFLCLDPTKAVADFASQWDHLSGEQTVLGLHLQTTKPVRIQKSRTTILFVGTLLLYEDDPTKYQLFKQKTIINCCAGPQGFCPLA